MKQNILLLALCLLLSSSCNFSDEVNHLGDGFYYMNEGSVLKMIFLSHEEKEPRLDEISILPKVESYVFDESFIVVKQIPDKIGLGWVLGFVVDEQTEERIDSLIQNNTYYKEVFSNKINYWIILKKKHQVLGPYNESNFNKERRELNILDEMIEPLFSEI
ncbi:hypothetical protein M2138_000971 [Dysgonomonadaceae bacterium PH5-43]|nr:hypothetical protein [Dysgonomonadaceae bacterium PH5-43]